MKQRTIRDKPPKDALSSDPSPSTGVALPPTPASGGHRLQQTMRSAVYSLLLLGFTGYVLYQYLAVMHRSSEIVMAGDNDVAQSTDLSLSMSAQVGSGLRSFSSSAMAFFSAYAIPTLLEQLSARAAISYDPGLAARHPNWIPLLDKQVAQIRRLLPRIINEKLLQTILEDPLFSIEIVTENNHQLTSNGKFAGAEGRYFPRLHKMLVVQDSDFNDQYLSQVLKNELYHAYIHQLNLKRTGGQIEDVMRMLLPFVNSDWSIDKEAFTALQAATNKGMGRVAELQKLLAKGRLSEAEAQVLAHYQQALATYEPHVYRTGIPYQPNLGRLLEEMPAAGMFPVRVTDYGSGDVTVFWTYAASENVAAKATAFLKSFPDEINNIDNGHYQRFDQPTKLMEKASSIAELSLAMLERFFPEWCAYHANYAATAAVVPTQQGAMRKCLS